MKLAIFAIILSVVVSLITTMPAISIDAGAVVTSSAYAYIRAGCYFLPMGTVLTILTLIVALWGVRIVIALIKMVWDLLPVA